jgi:hypothetical protein
MALAAKRARERNEHVRLFQTTDFVPGDAVESESGAGHREMPVSKARTHVTDLSQFLNKRGRVASMPEAAVRLVDFFGRIVVHATAPLTLEARDPVKCRRASGPRSCSADIEIRFDTESGAIAWRCPACGENGSITNWKDTPWDRRRDAARQERTAALAISEDAREEQ